MKLSSAALMIAFSVPNSGLADPSSECSGSSQVEIGNCVAETLERVDAVVEMHLGFAMESAKELDDVTGRQSAVPALEMSQALWSAYREGQCAFVGTTYGGGSGTGIAIDACKIELGRARAKDLLLYVQ